MRIQFNTQDSDGVPTTSSLTVTIPVDDGEDERYTVDNIASTGSARVPDRVGQYLVESDSHDVERFESTQTSDTAGGSESSEGSEVPEVSEGLERSDVLDEPDDEETDADTPASDSADEPSVPSEPELAPGRDSDDADSS